MEHAQMLHVAGVVAAVKELVHSAFPAAAVLSPPLAEEIVPRHSSFLPTGTALSDQIFTGPPLYGLGKFPSELWSQLATACRPSPSNTPGAYPRCVVVGAGAHACVTAAPHAVVAIGGFEATDLRRVVLPKLAEGVELLPSYVVQKESPSAHKRVETVRSRRKMPSYYVKKNFEKDTLAEKGCAAYGSSLVELSVVHPADGHRARAFILVANPEATVSELKVESQPSRRNALRAAFGVSLPLLQQALPRPLVAAAMAASAWQHREASKSGDPFVSGAFWLSALAHFLTLPDVALSRTAVPAAVSQLYSSVVKPHGTQDSSPPLREAKSFSADEWLVARAITTCALEWVLSCTEQTWNDILLRNYFFPAESFASCADVLKLSDHRAQLHRGLHLPVSEDEYLALLRRITTPFSLS